jgi:hypothetical protein
MVMEHVPPTQDSPAQQSTSKLHVPCNGLQQVPTVQMPPQHWSSEEHAPVSSTQQ